LFDLSTDEAADGMAYHVAARLEVIFNDEGRIISLIQFPRDLSEDSAVCAGSGRGEPVTWDGQSLPVDMWRQWKRETGEGSVQLTRPCAHNSWDNVRLKRGWVILRCRECGSQWRQRPFNASGGRCRTFTGPGGCGLGTKCPLLHVHAVKRTVEERAKKKDSPEIVPSKEVEVARVTPPPPRVTPPPDDRRQSARQPQPQRQTQQSARRLLQSPSRSPPPIPVQCTDAVME